MEEIPMGRVIENMNLLDNPPQSDEDLIKRLLPSDELEFGFIAPNESLSDLVERDSIKLSRIGVTHDLIATAIEKLFNSDGKSINGNPILRVSYVHSPQCPWGDFTSVSVFDVSPKITEIVVFNKDKHPRRVRKLVNSLGRIPIEKYPELVASDQVMIFSDLHPHLIRDHHFFEGSNNPYRVDPERVVRYLGLS